MTKRQLIAVGVIFVAHTIAAILCARHIKEKATKSTQCGKIELHYQSQTKYKTEFWSHVRLSDGSIYKIDDAQTYITKNIGDTVCYELSHSDVHDMPADMVGAFVVVYFTTWALLMLITIVRGFLIWLEKGE